MIPTLLITIAVEAVIASAYSTWRRKPVALVLLTSLVANLVTQSLLWIELSYFFQRYLTALLTGETLIWILESLLLYSARFNRLNLQESFSVSFGMNLASFAIGWWLPV